MILAPHRPEARHFIAVNSQLRTYRLVEVGRQPPEGFAPVEEVAARLSTEEVLALVDAIQGEERR